MSCVSINTELCAVFESIPGPIFWPSQKGYWDAVANFLEPYILYLFLLNVMRFLGQYCYSWYKAFTPILEDEKNSLHVHFLMFTVQSTKYSVLYYISRILTQTYKIKYISTDENNWQNEEAVSRQLQPRIYNNWIKTLKSMNQISCWE